MSPGDTGTIRGQTVTGLYGRLREEAGPGRAAAFVTRHCHCPGLTTPEATGGCGGCRHPLHGADSHSIGAWMVLTDTGYRKDLKSQSMARTYLCSHLHSAPCMLAHTCTHTQTHAHTLMRVHTFTRDTHTCVHTHDTCTHVHTPPTRTHMHDTHTNTRAHTYAHARRTAPEALGAAEGRAGVPSPDDGGATMGAQRLPRAQRGPPAFSPLGAAARGLTAVPILPPRSRVRGETHALPGAGSARAASGNRPRCGELV